MMMMGIDLPLQAIQRQIASALDIIVHIGRLRDRSRRVMQIAETEAERRHLVLPVLSQVLSEYEELDEKGYGDLGTQALYKYYMES